MLSKIPKINLYQYWIFCPNSIQPNIIVLQVIKNDVYKERLKEFNLWTLKKRRIMFDLVQRYKIAHFTGNIATMIQMFQISPAR